MTTFIEIEIDADGGTAWECLQCEALWVFETAGPEENSWSYCASCGENIETCVKLGDM